MAWERVIVVVARCFAISALAMLGASATACRNFRSAAGGSQDGASGGASTGGAGTLGTGGAGTVAGSGGSGGAAIADAGGPGSGGTGTGGAADGSLSTDAAGGAATLSADEACRAAVDALCRRAEVCFNSVCPKSAPYPIYPCPDYYFNDASERTPANITACLAEMERQPCSDVVLLARPTCFAEGKRAGGEGCAYSSQCRSGACEGGASTCGTCNPTAALGQPCGTDVGQCRSGEFCHRVTKVCTSASTIGHAAEGQPCDLSASPVAGCQGDLVCEVASDGGTVGTCRRAPVAGQPCAQMGGGLNAVCGGPETACVSGMCRFKRPCGDVGCDANSTCRTSDLTCVPRAGEGEACNDPTMDGRPLCGDRLTCDAVTRTCGRARANGESCDDAHPCSATLLRCTGGICQGIGAASCPAQRADAGTD